jgi:transglutaminase-like putative cysteine protease
VIRPVGVSAGGLGLLLSWVGGVAIAQLTGATPVVILLAAGFVLFAAAIVDGCFTMLRTSVGAIVLPHSSTQGEAVAITAEIAAPRSVFLEIRAADHEVAHGWTTTTSFAGQGHFERRGAVDEMTARVRTAGLLGLVWWGRRSIVPIPRHLVAPAVHPSPVGVERTGIASDGDLAGVSGAISGEIDGIRPWQDGDSEKFVHWSSSIRTGELMVHDRRQNADQRWVVRARSGTSSPDDEAGAARRVIVQGIRSGVSVMAAVDDAEPVPIDSIDAAIEWSALAPLGPTRPPARSWRDRFRRVEPDATATAAARWWAGAATLASLWMLAGALQYSVAAHLLVGVGVAASVVVSVRTLVTGELPSILVRTMVALGALGGLALVVAATGRLDGLLAVLRGPLPQLLVILVILHGFECRDRRTIRVGLGISAIVLMYASGLRVDRSIGWWMLAWAIAFGVAMAKLSGPTDAVFRRRPERSVVLPVRTWVLRTTGLGFAAVSTLVVLVVVPVPDGPARLTLPTLIQDAQGVPNTGGIAGPDGQARDAGTAGDEPGIDRAPAGQPGGYSGFAETMDTSVRGDLGDQVVMRVRAPGPAFWRGQTFSRFDGRRWYADTEIGAPRRGPDIEVPPAIGDTRVVDDVAVERFVQTYYLETDMPNVIFHASRPSQVIADTDVWVRPDGALRATTILPSGSIYTVVSNRVRVDDSILRRQGLIGPRLTDLGREVLGRYLEVPDSTSAATIALADELAAGEPSTYDVVLAYEAWMSTNVEYDLHAPLPEPGEDAVDDFLFDSKLGFCEQIASALTIMLRTQGVPARLTTGYVAGTRDEVAGVFEVRSSDAHAWVEVWFPQTGWQAFDPTAAVPLSANADIESVGADLADAVAGYLGDHPGRVPLVVGAGFGLLAAVRLGRVLVLRRRRGRWGTLQDRFAVIASGRGASTGATNPVLAEAWTGADDEVVARLVAERLDRVAFDPTFLDGDDVFAETRKLVGTLRRTDR